jgi:D-aminopeptidase
MVQKHRCLSAAEQPRQPDLTAGRRKQILPADDEVDPLAPIVHGDGELIRPVAQPVADQHVAALCRRVLLLPAHHRIVKNLHPWQQSHAPTEPVAQGQMTIAAATRIAKLGPDAAGAGLDLASRAVARVDETAGAKNLDGFPVDGLAVALTAVARARPEFSGGEDVRSEIQPVEVIENAGLIPGQAALAIVILDSQEHPPAQRARETPYVLRVPYVSKVKPAGGRRSESRQRRIAHDRSQTIHIHAEHARILVRHIIRRHKRPHMHRLAVIVLLTCAATASAQPPRPRARDLGVPFDGTPGPLNAITDVKGTEVGVTTLIKGDGPLKQGVGPVRTGVTVILPRGKSSNDPVMAGWFSMNGNGEMTGTTWIEEAGFLEGPVFLTNTHSVGVVRDAAIKWSVQHDKLFQPWSLPVVAETWDGTLNDINGFHVTPEHVFSAIDSASSSRVPEGNVGGGTGMICYEFKCGTGTASRALAAQAGGYTIGVLVQANHGRRSELRIAGVPVGREIPLTARQPAAEEIGSIIIVVATDAPLMPHQLKRLARRAALGLARTGATSGNSSGDIFIAFSTANAGAAQSSDVTQVAMLSNARISALFSATVEATEEAIVNALVAAETMTGAGGRTVEALPHARLRDVLKKYGR